MIACWNQNIWTSWTPTPKYRWPAAEITRMSCRMIRLFPRPISLIVRRCWISRPIWQHTWASSTRIMSSDPTEARALSQIQPCEITPAVRIARFRELRHLWACKIRLLCLHTPPSRISQASESREPAEVTKRHSYLSIGSRPLYRRFRVTGAKARRNFCPTSKTWTLTRNNQAKLGSKTMAPLL